MRAFAVDENRRVVFRRTEETNCFAVAGKVTLSSSEMITQRLDKIDDFFQSTRII